MIVIIMITTKKLKIGKKPVAKILAPMILLLLLPTQVTLAQDLQVVSQLGYGVVHAVAGEGNYAFIGRGAVLSIYDVSTPLDPKLVGEICLKYIVEGIYPDKDFVYVANSARFAIVDISNAKNPKLVGSCAISGARDVIANGNYAYVAASTGLYIVDISDKSNPRVISSVSCYGIRLDVANNYAYVAGDNYLYIINISNPEIPY